MVRVSEILSLKLCSPVGNAHPKKVRFDGGINLLFHLFGPRIFEMTREGFRSRGAGLG